MSCFHCEGCDRAVDSDFVGCEEHPHKDNELLCSDCFEEFTVKQQFLEIDIEDGYCKDCHLRHVQEDPMGTDDSPTEVECRGTPKTCWRLDGWTKETLTSGTAAAMAMGAR